MDLYPWESDYVTRFHFYATTSGRRPSLVTIGVLHSLHMATKK